MNDNTTLSAARLLMTNIFRIRFRLGEFDPPEGQPYCDYSVKDDLNNAEGTPCSPILGTPCLHHYRYSVLTPSEMLRAHPIFSTPCSHYPRSPTRTRKPLPGTPCSPILGTPCLHHPKYSAHHPRYSLLIILGTPCLHHPRYSVLTILGTLCS